MTKALITHVIDALVQHLTHICNQNFGPEVKEKASLFVPSTGKVTIVVLLRNLLVSQQPPRPLHASTPS